MSSFLEIDENTIAVKCPKDTTWAKVDEHGIIPFASQLLGLKSSCFLSYGKENTVYYDPKSFYLPEGNWEFDKIDGEFIILKQVK